MGDPRNVDKLAANLLSITSGCDTNFLGDLERSVAIEKNVSVHGQHNRSCDGV